MVFLSMTTITVIMVSSLWSSWSSSPLSPPLVVNAFLFTPTSTCTTRRIRIKSTRMILNAHYDGYDRNDGNDGYTSNTNSCTDHENVSTTSSITNRRQFMIRAAAAAAAVSVSVAANTAFVASSNAAMITEATEEGVQVQVQQNEMDVDSNTTAKPKEKKTRVVQNNVDDNIVVTLEEEEQQQRQQKQADSISKKISSINNDGTNSGTDGKVVDSDKNNDDEKKNKNQFDPRYFIAGGGCASVSHGIATPFDVVKTRIQSDPDTYNGGFQKTASTLVKNEGIGTLLTGLTPTLVGFGLEGGVKFGVYEGLKPVCMSLLNSSFANFNSDDKFLPYLLASLGAGAIASIMLCPMERARIKLVTEKEKSIGDDSSNDDASSSVGLFGGIGPLIQQEGLSSIFYGYSAMLFKQVPYTITKQCTFDLFASSLSVYAMTLSSDLPSGEVRFLSTVTAAFLASILACTVSQPGDIILTKKLKGANDKKIDFLGDGSAGVTRSEQTLFGLAKGIYDEKGIGGFYAGYSARLAHVAAIVTSQLVLYDFLKQALGVN